MIPTNMKQVCYQIFRMVLLANAHGEQMWYIMKVTLTGGFLLLGNDVYIKFLPDSNLAKNENYLFAFDSLFDFSSHRFMSISVCVCLPVDME